MGGIDRPFFLILGHPRCGTGYMAKLFQAWGFDVGHEKMGEDGISCWAWATNDPAPPWSPGQRSKLISEQVEKGKTIHTICAFRHPLDAIQSIAFADPDEASRSFRSHYTVQFQELGPLSAAAMSYLGWYNLILAQCPEQVVKVEEADKWIEFYISSIKSKFWERTGQLPENTYNSRQYVRRPRSNVLAMLDGAVRRHIEFLCLRIGYAIPQTGIRIHPANVDLPVS